MNFTDHKNYGLAVSALLGIAYYVYFAANYFRFTGEIAYSYPLMIESLFMFALTFAGSQVSDLDTNSIPSKIVSIFLMIWWGFVLFLEYYSSLFNISASMEWQPVAISTFAFLVCSSSKHRSFTHALGWCPILLAYAYFTGLYVIGGFAIGMATHFYCDKISPLRLNNWWFNPFRLSFWV